LEPELSDSPPYAPLVHPAASASPRHESDSEDPNKKEEASDPQTLPVLSNGSLVIPPFALSGPGERHKPLGKVAIHWEANEQGGRNPSCDTMRSLPGSRATITPGSQVICTPQHTQEPQAVMELLTNIMHSHQPNWDDCHQLMSTLFTSDECRQIHQAARAWLVTQDPPQTANPE
jgi:hypothetical protein